MKVRVRVRVRGGKAWAGKPEDQVQQGKAVAMVQCCDGIPTSKFWMPEWKQWELALSRSVSNKIVGLVATADSSSMQGCCLAGEETLRRDRGEWCAVCAVCALCVPSSKDG